MIGYDKWEYAESFDPRFPDSFKDEPNQKRKFAANTALTKKLIRSEKNRFYGFIPRMDRLERSFSR